jgi:TatD DNase family protein
MPLDKILIETDAPYLTPVPYRGKRNEPIYVREVAVKIAAIKNMSVEEVIKITGVNAKKLFNLK